MEGMDEQTPAEERAAEEKEAAWRRKRRLAEIFGDVLPETTRDERDERRPTRGADPGEEWLKRQVPPHHG